MDVTGDGLTDLVHLELIPAGIEFRALLATGTGSFVQRVNNFSSGLPLYEDTLHWRPMDINGDGLADLVHIRANYSKTWPSPQPNSVSCLNITMMLADGNGGWRPETYKSACNVASTPEDTRFLEDTNFVRTTDVNGDGRADLVHISTYRDTSGARKSAIVTLRNSAAEGGTWRVDRVKAAPLPASYDHRPWAWQPWRTPQGDPGFAYVHPQNVYAASFKAPSDRLEILNNGRGATTSVTYGPLVGSRDYLPLDAIPSIVTSVEVRDHAYPTPLSDSVTYDMGGARWSATQRRLLGFAWMRSRESRSSTLTAYQLSDACGRQVSQSSTFDAAGARYPYSTIQYVAPTATGGPPYKCDVARARDYECELTSSCRLSREVTLNYDIFGNVVLTEDRADQSPARRTKSPVYPNVKQYIVDRSASQTVFEADGSNWRMRSQLLRYYDQNTTHAAPPGALGEVRQTHAWDDVNSVYRVSTIDYDARGNVVKTVDPAGQWQTIIYDPIYGLHPETTCNATFCNTMKWDLTRGVRLTQSDPNGQTTAFTYDTFGRLART